nr:hypothetical protein HK105_005478 [Polyrhizophydium stewartii]
MILSLAGWTTQQPPRVAASLASVQTTLVLALLAFFAGISAAARSTNKTQSTVVIPVVGDYLEFAGDQTLFGVRMAIQEINNSSDILQDVALIPMRINLDLTNPATLYDSSISLYPLYFRYVSTFTQLAGGIAAQFKYFGWSKIGIVSASSSIYPTVLSTYVDVFKGYGVSVLATVILPDYDSSVSTMYYPQIRQPFEFLRQTGLRIFFASVPPQQIMDVMMAANKTGLVGRDYYTALDPMLLRGVALIQNIQGPFFDDPYYQSWKPRFDTFLAHTLAYETSLYHDINPSQTDPTAQDYPSSFFFDDPGTNQYPAFFLLAGYDGMWTIARTLERAIVRSGLDGMALANGSLAPFVKLSDVIDIAANMNTLVGVKSLTSSGDASPDPLYLSQLTGATFGMNSAVRVAVIEYNSTTAKSTVGNRTFFDFPIDYPPANNDYVDPQSSITVAVVAGKDVYSDSVYLGASSKYLWVCEITWEGSALLGTAIAMISGMACLALFFGYANRDLPDMFNNSKAGAGATALSALFASITLAQGSKSLHIEAKLVAADTEAAAEIKRQRNVIAFNGGIFPQWRRIMVVLFPEPVFMVKLMAKSDSEIPKYLPLRSLKNVYHRDNISKLDLPMCVLEVGDVRVTMQFSSTSKMRAWIDAVGRATLRQRAIGHSQGHSPSGIPIELPPQGQLIEELRSGKRK